MPCVSTPLLVSFILHDGANTAWYISSDAFVVAGTSQPLLSPCLVSPGASSYHSSTKIAPHWQPILIRLSDVLMYERGGCPPSKIYTKWPVGPSESSAPDPCRAGLRSATPNCIPLVSGTPTCWPTRGSLMSVSCQRPCLVSHQTGRFEYALDFLASL